MASAIGKLPKSELHPSNKIVCLLPVCIRNNRHLSSRPHFRAVRKVLWTMVNNCLRNRSRPHEIDTETEICTSLKFEFYFRSRWPPSTKSTLISYISFAVFVTIRGKVSSPQLRNWKMGILHTSEIGNLLPVYLRNNVLQNNQISERHAKFGENQ